MNGLRFAALGWAGLLWSAAACAGDLDTVTMRNGLFLEGKINRETPEYVVLLVDDGATKIQIPRERIKAIDYDFSTRAAALAEDDYKGHLELGLVAFQRRMYAETVQELEKAKSLAATCPDYFKDLGQAYDHQGKFKEAYECYRQYRLGHPEETELAKRMLELGKSLGADGATNAPVPKPTVREGLEATLGWFAERWADSANPCTVNVIEQPESGNQVVAVQVQAGSKEKSAFTGIGKKPLDLSEVKELVCKVYHTGAVNVRLSLACKNEAREFYETREQPIPPNTWTKVVFPVTGKVFKCEKSNWAYTAELSGPEAVTSISFLIYGTKDLTFYVDSIFAVNK